MCGQDAYFNIGCPQTPEQRFTLEFRHDVYKFLFYGKGEEAKEKNWGLFYESDFSKCKLPPYWNSIYDKHGVGVKIRFPLKMRKFLHLSPKTYQSIGGIKNLNSNFKHSL